jgi:hypothetical protein
MAAFIACRYNLRYILALIHNTLLSFWSFTGYNGRYLYPAPELKDCSWRQTTLGQPYLRTMS